MVVGLDFAQIAILVGIVGCVRETIASGGFYIFPVENKTHPSSEALQRLLIQ